MPSHLHESRHTMQTSDQANYVQMLECLGGIVWEADLRRHQFIFISEQADLLLGYSLAEWQSPDFWKEHLHPADRDWVLDLFSGSGSQTHLRDFKYRLIASDGQVLWFRDVVSVVVEGGEARRLRGVMLNLTDGMMAFEARDDHLRFLEILDRVNRAMQQTTDLEQMVQSVLEAVLRIFDCDRAWLTYPCDPDQPTCQSVREYTKPKYAVVHHLDVKVATSDAEVKQLLQVVRDANGPVAFGPGSEFALPNTLRENFEVLSQLCMAIYPNCDLPYMFGLHQCSRPRVWPLQERRQFQEIGRRLADALCSQLAFRQLRASERRLDAAQQMANVAWWERDMESGRASRSRESYSIFGLADGDWEELASWDRQWRERIHPDDLQRTTETLRIALEGGPRYDLEYRVVRPTGEIRYVHSQADVTFDAAGKPLRIFGTMQDITDLRMTERELRASEARFRALVDHAADAFFLLDARDIVLDVNQQACDSLNFTRNELIGRKSLDFDTEVTASRTNDLLARLDAGDMFAFETQHRRRDGTTFPVDIRIRPFWEGDQRFAVALARDITDRKRLEERLRQSQKMEAVGRLAGGVAHDFNNLLTVINSYSDMLAQGLADDNPQQEWAREVLKAGERAANLTRQLLAFSRKQVLLPQIVNFNLILSDLINLLGRLIGEDIELNIDMDPDLGLALVDPSQFEQAIINLAVNSRDAMPDGGKITLVTKNVELYASSGDIQPGRYLSVVISDTGQGMDETTKSRIFEPFFTTKEQGKGTGLGLSMVYGFVKQSDGHIEVLSEVDSGTTFRIYLPRIDTPIATHAPTLPQLVMPAGTETVLLVEDEEAVRVLTRNILLSCGYKVLEAQDGEEGLTIALQHSQMLDLLITDLVMPRMGGQRLANLILEIRPDLRILFLSGYIEDAVLRKCLRAESVPFLQKPYSAASLARKVRDVLDARHVE